MSDKVALITGITGQDGAFLARLLLEKGYVVHGLRRHASMSNLGRIERLIGDDAELSQRLTLHYGDMSDAASLTRVVAATRPDEIYNLAAQSHVRVSFATPELTANIDGLGALRLLEAIRVAGLEQHSRYYQASTSELFGQARDVPQNEKTPFYPRSPYAAAKLYAHAITINYREAYGLHASNGILFNHDSPLRGESFVTRKVSLGVAAIHLGLPQSLVLGNLDAQRDWGHAREYMEGAWRMLQQPAPGDYVLATGVATSVRNFVELAFAEVGIALDWQGRGEDEKGFDRTTGRCLVAVDPACFRPTDVELLLGDASKARRELGWAPKASVQDIAAEMVRADIELLSRRLDPGRW